MPPESPLRALKRRSASTWIAHEPKAPRAPAGRVVASPDGVSEAAGPKAPLLDTLAQLDQRPGTDDKRKLLNRARAKHLTFPLAIALAELRSPLEKSYRNAVYCAAYLEQDEYGKIRGLYCQTRWCLVCNRVRLARAINRYYGPISEWQDRQFVTLTLPNVQARELADTIAATLQDAANIGRAIRQTDRLTFRSLRKIECTYNPERDDYHPHLHFVVEGKDSTHALVRRWLARHADATAPAQDIRPCDDGSLLELFKYFTKIIVKRPDGSGSRMVAPVEALDVIFLAMRGRRVYQSVGFKVAVDPTNDESGEIGADGDTAAVKRLGERVQWEWIQQLHDWVDLSSGEMLTGYEPTDGMRATVGPVAKGIGRPERKGPPNPFGEPSHSPP